MTGLLVDITRKVIADLHELLYVSQRKKVSHFRKDLDHIRDTKINPNILKYPIVEECEAYKCFLVPLFDDQV